MIHGLYSYTAAKNKQDGFKTLCGCVLFNSAVDTRPKVIHADIEPYRTPALALAPY